MADELLAIMGDDGVFREYDSTHDITIHCESHEEQKAIMERMIGSVSRKKIDEMIAEIEHRKESLDYTLSVLVKGDAMEGRLQGAKEAVEEMIRIIHKYCDKEQKNV